MPAGAFGCTRNYEMAGPLKHVALFLFDIGKRHSVDIEKLRTGHVGG